MDACCSTKFKAQLATRTGTVVHSDPARPRVTNVFIQSTVDKPARQNKIS